MKKINKYQKFLVIYFIAMVVLWAGLWATDTKAGNWNYWFSFLFGLIPLVGGAVGIVKSSIWGRFKSTLGKAVFFISLGLLLWGLGETIWSYYNFFKHVPAPYPSLADIGFAPSIFFWILGTIYLAKASGALFVLKKSTAAKVLAILVPLLLLIPSYYIQVTLARGGSLLPEGETSLKVVLDIVYPFGDFLALVFAGMVFSLSYKYFGGFYRKAITSILLGLFVMYCGDSVFSYTTTEGTYYNADWGDMFLALGLSLITFGILAFCTKPTVKQSADTK
ncbi:MAG TPA: hypothetical protein VLF88_01465 [Candidatus Babeliales bacterium]|nr:hypothetical protein [Candidatus Babeliales bacterium]